MCSGLIITPWLIISFSQNHQAHQYQYRHLVLVIPLNVFGAFLHTNLIHHYLKCYIRNIHHIPHLNKISHVRCLYRQVCPCYMKPDCARLRHQNHLVRLSLSYLLVSLVLWQVFWSAIVYLLGVLG